MVRNALGIVLAVLAAACAVVSPFLDWYGNRDGRAFRMTDLFTSDGISGDNANLVTGLFVPMLVAAVLLLAGCVLRWGWLMAVAGLIVLGFTILWAVRQYQVSDSLAVSRDGLGEGVGLALVSGVLALVAGAATYGRGSGRHRRGRPADEARPHEERGGEVVEGPWGYGQEPDRPHGGRDVA
ncbi:hypothetical protein [Streptomyces sp. B6B3]|uniref:hypothetical protein n=1 Tax=Streptomyces sp. B6B3 TaxID=3153570 RepID=UPI00325E7749